MALEQFNDGEQNSSIRTKLNAAIAKINTLSAGAAGSIGSAGNIMLDNSAGTNYGTITELSGNIIIDDASAVLGGTALIYHKAGTAPTITTGLTKQVIPYDGAYVPNESNLIAISMISGSRIGIVYNQLTVDSIIDTEDPTAPTSLTSPSKTTNTVDLSWVAGTDNVGVTGYVVYKDSVYEKEVGTTTAQITGLTQGTSYSFTVSSVDAAGNESAQTSPLVIATTAGADVTAPTISSATVEDANPSTLVVAFSEVVTITDTTGLTIAGAATPTLSAPTGSGTNTLSFTLSTPLTNGQAVTLEVAGTNNIIDGASNALAVISQAITNNVGTSGMPLLSSYPMTETTGAMIDTVSAYNGTTFGAIARDGVKYTFDGVDDYVSIPHNSEQNFVDVNGDVPFEIELKIAFDAFASVQWVVSKRDLELGIIGWGLVYGANTSALLLILPTSDNASTIRRGIPVADLTVGTEQKILFKYDGSHNRSGITAEINDVPVSTYVDAGNATYPGMSANTADVTVGKLNDLVYNSGFAGTLRDIKIRK